MRNASARITRIVMVAATAALLAGATAGPATAGPATAGPATATADDNDYLREGDVFFWQEPLADGATVLFSEPGTACVNLPFPVHGIANLVGEVDVHAGTDCAGAVYHSPLGDLHSFPRGFVGLSFRVLGD